MIFIFAILVIAVATVIAIFRSEKSLKHILAEAKYEVIYNVVGTKGLLEDFLMKRKNKTTLITKTGKTALITGGTRGIGVEVIKMLMQCDINVVMGCRNTEAGEKMLIQIREQGVKTGSLKVFQLDISSLKSVESFAKIITDNFSALHYLINNAGIMYVPYAESDDGFESQFATNYLGHFYLTHLLLGLLKKTGTSNENARIVNVTSCAYLTGDINLEDINNKDMHIAFKAYSQSKLAQLLFSNYLNKVLTEEKACVEVYGVHPGIVNTDLFDNTHVKVACWWLLPYIFKTPEQGAMPIIHTCLSAELEGKGGSYVSNCSVQAQKDVAKDEEVQKNLFNYTLKVVNASTFGKVC